MLQNGLRKRVKRYSVSQELFVSFFGLLVFVFAAVETVLLAVRCEHQWTSQNIGYEMSIHFYNSRSR